MTGCVIFCWTDELTVNHYYSTQNGRMVRMPSWEGETIIYDVKAFSDIYKNFRGYSPDYIEKFIEVFRAVDES